MVLYVGNLPFDTTDGDLAGLFARYGTVVTARVATDRATGRPHGFGYVVIRDGGDQAIMAVNGALYRGRTLVAGPAGPPQARPPTTPTSRPRAPAGSRTGHSPAGKKAAVTRGLARPSEACRREAFRALVEAQDGKATVTDSRRAVARKYALTEGAVRAIEAEGLANDWPPL
jgi:RNA recognition motif-containing protein